TASAAAPKPAPQNAQTAAAPETTEAIADAPAVISLKEKIATTLEPIAQRAMTAAGPIGAKAVLALSKPLANKSPDIRNAVGWVALWTMFLSVVVWGWALFFNTSSVTAPTQAPTPIVAPEITPGVTASHQP
ncbi:MAG: hypothetical protein JKY96_09275, partial [Phycisphaerales bacterium]|nr:hypothetical protein [Phycisphaerales bacterium]